MMAEPLCDNTFTTASRVDYFAQLLASSPLVQRHVRRQWWDRPALALNEVDTESNYSHQPATPSLTDGSTCSDPGDHIGDRIDVESKSLPPFDSPEGKYRHGGFRLDTGITNSLPPTTDSTHQHRPRTLVIADSTVHGAPVRYASHEHHLSSAMPHFGTCSFLKVPYGASDAAELKVLLAEGGSGHNRIVLQIVSHLVDRRTGKKSRLLAVDLDVTEHFVEAAVDELARISALLDGSKTNPALSMSHLEYWNCTPRTRALLGRMERLRAQHIDLLVLQASSSVHADGTTPKGIRVPWASQHWHRCASSWPPGCHGRRLRESMVAAVAKVSQDSSRASSEFLIDAMPTRAGQDAFQACCVPLCEADTNSTERAAPRTWVCFVQRCDD